MTVQLTRRQVLLGGLGFGAGLILPGCSGEEAKPTPTTEARAKYVIGRYNFVSTDGIAGPPMDLATAAQLFRTPTKRWSIEFDGANLKAPRINTDKVLIFNDPAFSATGTNVYHIGTQVKTNSESTQIALVSVGTEDTNQNLAVTLWPYNPVTSKDVRPVNASPTPIGGDKTVSAVYVHRYDGVDEITFRPGQDVDVLVSTDSGDLINIDPFSKKYVTPNGWTVDVNVPHKTFEIKRTISAAEVVGIDNFPGIAIVANNTVTGETFALSGLTF